MAYLAALGWPAGTQRRQAKNRRLLGVPAAARVF
jgi:hypothetical protein